MKILILLSIVLLCGCSSMHNELEKQVTKETEKSINKIIDEKVNASLKSQLPLAVREGIGGVVMDYSPYILSVLVAMLAGKYGIDAKKWKTKHDQVKKV